MKEKLILFIILLLGVVLRQTVSWNLLFSISSVAALWFLIEALFPKQRLLKIVSAFFLAISPWHINLASLSLQINMAILSATVGVVILVKIFNNLKLLYISAAVFILIIGQLVYPLNLNLTNARDVVWLIDQQRREHGEDYNSFLSVTLHNKAINYSLSFTEHWGEHFSGDFLFIVGNPSLMYLVDILFLLVGFFNIFKKGDLKRWGVILLWLAFSPINSAFEFAPPDFVQAALMVVPLVIISSFGAVLLFERIQSIFKRLYN